jgi:hypothetical protein
MRKLASIYLIKAGDKYKLSLGDRFFTAQTNLAHLHTNGLLDALDSPAGP